MGARLQAIGDPLFALLDAARDPGVLAALQDGGQPYESLYEGAEADNLADYGPFLVSLDGGDGMLQRLVEHGWGQSWGVYLASPADFAALRDHFRRYVRVEIAGDVTALFRFYDPRVLREVLACWSAAELHAFFGPVSCFAVEDAAGSAIPQEHPQARIGAAQPLRPRLSR